MRLHWMDKIWISAQDMENQVFLLLEIWINLNQYQRQKSSKQNKKQEHNLVNIKYIFKFIMYGSKNKPFLHMFLYSHGHPSHPHEDPHGAQNAWAHIDLPSYINPCSILYKHLCWVFMTLFIGHMTLTNLLYSSIWMLFVSIFLSWGDSEAMCLQIVQMCVFIFM